MIIDFKAHVMPGMDKTCKNRIDTIRRLMAAKDAGVDLIVAAPVYDPDECSVEEFLDRRRQSEDILGSLMNDELPEVMTAAMVKFSDKLLTADELDKLCFGDRCFILNMRDTTWDDTTEAVLRRLTGRLCMNVILADASEDVLKTAISSSSSESTSCSISRRSTTKTDPRLSSADRKRPYLRHRQRLGFEGAISFPAQDQKAYGRSV